MALRQSHQKHGIIEPHSFVHALDFDRHLLLLMKLMVKLFVRNVPFLNGRSEESEDGEWRWEGWKKEVRNVPLE